MKRTRLLRKTPLKGSKIGLKRSKLNKTGKLPISKIQKKLWELCKRIIRSRYAPICYTCDSRNLSGKNWQTGHMWAKASVGAFLKYDLRILRPQCSTCNIWQGGRGADFYAKMLKEIGPEAMAKLESDRQVIVKAYDHYEKLIIEYELMLKKYE